MQDTDPSVPDHKLALPVLEYAAPLILFRGQYDTRSKNDLRATIVMLLLGAVSFWGPTWAIGSMADGGVARPIIVVFRFVGVAFLALSIHDVWQTISGQHWDVLVTDEGITRNGRVYPWQRISSFGPLRLRDRAAIQFVAQELFPLPRLLELTPALTIQEYQDLAQQLVQHLSERYPNLRIEVELGPE